MYKRGGIYGVILGAGRGEASPCLVVSNNIGNEYSPVITVIPLTFSGLEKIYEFETLLPGSKTGLGMDAKVGSHVIFTVEKNRFAGERIGFVNRGLMEKVERALRFQLSL